MSCPETSFNPEWEETAIQTASQYGLEKGGLVMRVDSSYLSVEALRVIFFHFPRQALRDIARQNGIPVGRDKSDTIRHLVQARLPLDIVIPTLPLWKKVPETT